MKLVVRIKKDFGDFLLDVNFVSEDKNLALLGESGCGKSVTLKCIAGIIKPDEGYIELNGRVLFDSEHHINLSPQKRKVGYLFQSYALFPNMTVRKNIYAGLHNVKDKNAKDEILYKYVNMLHISDILEKYPSQISGGQAQRVALARILVSSPEIVLLDEPFSALDGFLRNKLQLEMKDVLKDYPGQAILVTHDRDEAYMLSDSTSIISGGKTVITKSTKELFENPEYLAASILTGCKNHDSVTYSNGVITATNWGIDIKYSGDVQNIKYIGVRAHSFSPDEKENSNPIIIKEVVNQPFEKLVVFKFIKQKEESSDIYWLVDKNLDVEKVNSLGFKTSKMLVLKDTNHD